jgi:hypothetical protein
MRRQARLAHAVMNLRADPLCDTRCRLKGVGVAGVDDEIDLIA